MQNQAQFVDRRSADWRELRFILDGGRPLHRQLPETIARAAALYRAVCGDLVRAESAGYAREVLAPLHDLTARAHNALYRAPPHRLGAILDFLRRDFPRTLRRHRRALALAAALFVLPGVLGFAGALRSRAFALQILSPQAVGQMEEAYSAGFRNGRGEGQDTAMAGFYVANNIGIAFRCFATGVLFGLGSAFFLVYNGLSIGTVAGLVAAQGHGRNILTFTCTHGAFELTAIVIAGTAGIVMGYALVETGGRTRFGSLRRHARDVAYLVLGAAAMLFVAAMLEGFWSAAPIPDPVKWATGMAASTAVTLYLVFAGRRPRGEAPAAREEPASLPEEAAR